VLLLIQGCLGEKPLPGPDVPDLFPETFVQKRGSGLPVQDLWWESFGSRELNLMVEDALGSNFTIREALARFQQSKALFAEKRSSLFPTIELGFGIEHKRTINQEKSTLDTLSIGPGASYEVDLWGGIRYRTTAGELSTRASSLDLETAAMTVAAEVAVTWVDLKAYLRELELVKQQLRTNTIFLGLLELRFENSLSSALDVLQQQEIVARVNSQMPALENSIKQLSNRLCLLQGKPPAGKLFVEGTSFAALPPLPSIGIPADLLAKRPDIRASGLLLMAGHWERAAAKKERLPSLNLTGSMIYENSGLDTLFNSWILSLGASLAANLFDGGKRVAAVEMAEGVVEERLASYEKIVFTAIVEVEDSLAEEIHQKEWLVFLNRELAVARLALGEATNRYQKGLSSFLPLLSEELNVQGLERGIIRQEAELIKARISLHRFLGGTWTEGGELGSRKNRGA